MGFGGGWRPDSRRNRREGGRPDRRTGEKADRLFVVVIVVFVVLTLTLVVAAGVLGPS